MAGSVKTTVGVPLYNESRYVRETIASLKAQTSDNFIVYIGDNCSSDGTLDIVRNELAGDMRFHIISHVRNIGALANFEYLRCLANSDYFMWLGGHDRLSPNALQQLGDALDSNLSASMAMAYPHALTDECDDGGPIKKALYQFAGTPFERYCQSASQLEDCTIFHALHRTRIAREFRFEPVLGADHAFISMLLWHGDLIYDPASAYYRRQFPAVRADPKIQMERATGESDANRNWEDHVAYYIRSFSRLYDGPAEEFWGLRGQLAKSLAARFEMPPSSLWRSIDYLEGQAQKAAFMAKLMRWMKTGFKA